MDSHEVENARGLVRKCESELNVLRYAASSNKELSGAADEAASRYTDAAKTLAELLEKEEKEREEEATKPPSEAAPPEPASAAEPAPAAAPAAPAQPATPPPPNP